MDGKRYPIVTVADLARIPEEALPRFLNEIPAIIETMRPTVAIIDALQGLGVADKLHDVQTYAGAVWIDDDKNEGSVSITEKNSEGVSLSRVTMDFDLKGGAK